MAEDWVEVGAEAFVRERPVARPMVGGAIAARDLVPGGRTANGPESADGAR
jgi:hypothetical protein